MHNSVRGATRVAVLAGVAVIAVAGFTLWSALCPCERAPGGYLFGEESSEPVTDWTFANDVDLCQIEVRSWGLPHSVNLNCMAADGDLYLSCASCDGKYWSTAALQRPDARLRVGTKVYPVTVSRVQDPATLDLAWRARADKVGRGADQPRQEGWWSFRVVSRGA
ncbi:MAG: hypothetical protein R3E82_04125 [Pseudomonadales bacterium]|nr:hypothetical protein [Pseudomonadales bacterium]